MTSPHNTDQQRVEHARRVLAEASNGLLVADWGTLYWIAEQVPQLLDVIDHLLPEAGARGADNGDPLATVPQGVAGYRPCRQCGELSEADYCGEKCERNWRGSEYRGWYPR